MASEAKSSGRGAIRLCIIVCMCILNETFCLKRVVYDEYRFLSEYVLRLLLGYCVSGKYFLRFMMVFYFLILSMFHI